MTTDSDDEDADYPIGDEVLEAIDREFRSSPDRVVAVVGGAYLDAMLDALLRRVFIDEPAEVDRLLRHDAPLGSNGTRYQVAYCLGLITKDIRDDLKVLAKVRNEFAHNFKITSFDDEPARGLCSSLKVRERLLAAAPTAGLHRDEAAAVQTFVRQVTGTARETFQMAVYELFGALYRRGAFVRRATRDGWFRKQP